MTVFRTGAMESQGKASNQGPARKPVQVGASGKTTTVPAIGVAQENLGQGEIALTLSDYPDVGRVSEVAPVLRCSKWCVYDLINTGALKSIRLGRAIRVTRRSREEFLTG